MENLIKILLRHKVVLSCLLLLSVMTVSCSKGEIYSQYHELTDASWGYNDTLVYDIDSTLFELNTPYKVTIELTNNVGYPYQNIWFFMQANFESDSVFTGMSKEYQLADEFGKWLGSGFGSLYQSSLSVEDVIFKEKRNYQIKLEHGMRDESLKGIEKIGIRIQKKAE